VATHLRECSFAVRCADDAERECARGDAANLVRRTGVADSAGNGRLVVMNVKDWPVMRAQCASCPFRVDERGRHPDLQLVGRIQMQVITRASQICHEVEGYLCRGGRDYQLMIFHRLGVLVEPTDEAWKQARLLYERDS
jgi:hypothetical protein